MTLLTVFSGVKSVDVENCGGVDVKADIKGCTDDPCQLKRGGSYQFLVDFKQPFEATKLVAEIKAKVGPLSVKWPGFDTDTCNGKGITCPVKKDQNLNYKIAFNVNQNYPAITTDVTFKMFGDQKAEVFCFKLPLTLV